MKFKFTILSILVSTVLCYSQMEKGLEGIIVEKYYISDAKDAANTTGGALPVGSTTYRVFADLKKGYKFQAAYGDVNHAMTLETTTKFFNNEDRGDFFPVFNKNALKGNTVMLDSWLSAGGACVGNLGILKSKDDGVGTVVNSDGILANNDPMAGIPLTAQDGLVLGKVQPVQSAGLDDFSNVLNNTNDAPNGVKISTNSGAWFNTLGAQGADTTENMVLIAQFTTDGVLKFEINIQLATPIPGITQSFVAKDPTGDEIFEPSLSFDSSKLGTSTTNENISQSFSVFPNPANNEIYFKLDDFIKDNSPFSIHDLNGKVVRSGVIDLGNQRLDISDLGSGIFIMSVESNNRKVYSRLVKI